MEIKTLHSTKEKTKFFTTNNNSKLPVHTPISRDYERSIFQDLGNSVRTNRLQESVFNFPTDKFCSHFNTFGVSRYK